MNYTDERFYTYLNQGSVDAYTLVNLASGYRFRGFGPVEELSIQLDATNLTDKEYFSTHRLERLHRDRPERHVAVAAAGRPASVLPLRQSEVLNSVPGEKNRGNCTPQHDSEMLRC